MDVKKVKVDICRTDKRRYRRGKVDNEEVNEDIDEVNENIKEIKVDIEEIKVDIEVEVVWKLSKGEYRWGKSRWV